MENKNTLPADVAEKYTSVNTPGPVIMPAPYGRAFDLRTISLADAEFICQHSKGILVPVDEGLKPGSTEALKAGKKNSVTE